jgi:hypothetical protein
MLQQPDVPRHQRRRGKAEDLPEGEVPGHDREDRADRLIGHEAAGGGGLHHLVGEEALGVLRIVAAAPGALRRLIHAGFQRLPHLGRHDPAERFLLGLENLGGAGHHLRPLGERGAPVPLVRVGGASQAGFELRGGERIEGPGGLARGGVGAGDGHDGM